MSENEEKAIKILKDTRQAWARIVYRYILKQQKEIEELTEELQMYVDTNLMKEKLLKEIEELKEEIDTHKETENDYEHELARKDEEIEELKNTKPKYIVSFKKLKEVEEDKIKELSKTQAYKVGLEEYTIKILQELLEE